MPISVQQLVNVKRPISILIDGEELNCVYRLSALGYDLGAWLRDHQNDEGSLLDMAERLLVSWDLVDGDNHTITPTRAEIERHNIPLPVLMAIFEKIGEDTQSKNLARHTGSKG